MWDIILTDYDKGVADRLGSVQEVSRKGSVICCTLHHFSVSTGLFRISLLYFYNKLPVIDQWPYLKYFWNVTLKFFLFSSSRLSKLLWCILLSTHFPSLQTFIILHTRHLRYLDFSLNLLCSVLTSHSDACDNPLVFKRSQAPSCTKLRIFCYLIWVKNNPVYN